MSVAPQNTPLGNGSAVEDCFATSIAVHSAHSMHRLQNDNLGRPFLVFTRCIAWSLAVAIVVLSIVPPRLRPETALPHGLEHFTIFFVTGVAFGVGYAQRHLRSMVLLVIFSGVVEMLQLLAPGRHARLTDFVLDALAVCVGAMTPLLAKQMVARPRS